jgi:2'-5' RNA ligase
MSLMIAMYPDLDTARKMAIPGGEKPEEIHLTLVYVSEYPTAMDVGNSIKAVSAFVREQDYSDDEIIYDGRTSGFGRFVNEDDPDVLYAGVDLNDLVKIRRKIIRELKNYDVRLDIPKHGFTPHMTLKYMRASDPIPFDRYPTHELSFDSISIVSDSYRYDIPVKDHLSMTVNYTVDINT